MCNGPNKLAKQHIKSPKMGKMFFKCLSPHTFFLTAFLFVETVWSVTSFPLTSGTIQPFKKNIHRHKAEQDDHHLDHLQVEHLQLLQASLCFFLPTTDILSLNHCLYEEGIRQIKLYQFP